MIAVGLAIALLSTPPQAATADADGYRPSTAAYNFALELPADATLTRREILDFDLYRVSVDGVVGLNLYEGWSANVGDWVTDRHAAGRQERKVGDLTVEYFWNQQCDGWSNEVHAWITADTPPEIASRAREIADTVVMKPCFNTPEE
ncbi:hypothetical protein KOAAANKH_01633 [Brevundimonas sp. NIBR10]|uniref:hypothetical protein n=1 Tax=Brevundimonas sp. NIBR10 TaxID=3015997 RepID=UPI0022F17945|nr:hypothetical protein [Brevundimonas sp. NIBR10]WGM46760.1 hypothetical protein KOAAANKH_01633 [Brevundimonas sp. NIBR10]